MVVQLSAFYRWIQLSRYFIKSANIKIRQEFTKPSKEVLHFASYESATLFLVQSVDLNLNPIFLFQQGTS